MSSAHPAVGLLKGPVAKWKSRFCSGLQAVCYSGEIWKERQWPTMSDGKKFLSPFFNALGHTVSRVHVHMPYLGHYYLWFVFWKTGKSLWTTHCSTVLQIPAKILMRAVLLQPVVGCASLAGRCEARLGWVLFRTQYIWRITWQKTTAAYYNIEWFSSQLTHYFNCREDWSFK